MGNGIESLDKDVVYFGRVNFRGQNRLFGIKRKDRRQHMYLVGKTGTGKTTLINNMMIQDIANGEGMCVVDPHGELAEGLLTKIPAERLNDVIYFNPADPEFSIGFNVLELPDPRYKHLVASGLMGIFTKIWAGVWSARMEYIMNNCVLALLDTPGSTLLGITRILVDKDFRQRIVSNVKDPVVKAFWVNEYEEWKDQFRNEAIAPIQNKVGQFLSTSIIRNIVGQAKSTIDIFDIMNSGKIFIVNVSKGRLGEDNSALLGAMLITKIQLAAMERVRILEEDRVDFFLYVDEFQNFATDSFASILSEARKYRLNLTLAHQYIGQLMTDTSTMVRDAVFGNVGTMIMFRVGATDAEFLEKEYEPEFLPEDMVGLPNASIYLKLMVDGVTSRPFSAATLPPFKVVSSELTELQVIEVTRKRYARPTELVEREVIEWAGMGPGGGEGPSGELPAGKFQAVCSSCGKNTIVPFEPIPGRPVYCLECLNKIKSGELQPVRIPRFYQDKGSEAPSQPAGPASQSAGRRGYGSDLAGLGIEFEGEGGSAPDAPEPSLRPSEVRQPVDGGRPRSSVAPSEGGLRPTSASSPAPRPATPLSGGTGIPPRPAVVPQQRDGGGSRPIPTRLAEDSTKRANKQESSRPFIPRTPEPERPLQPRPPLSTESIRRQSIFREAPPNAKPAGVPEAELTLGALVGQEEISKPKSGERREHASIPHIDDLRASLKEELRKLGSSE